MLSVPRAFLVVLATLGILSGCTREAKKARLLGRADAHFQSGDYEKAEIEYLNVLRLDPKDLQAVRRLGSIWFERGDSIRALRFFFDARDLAPTDPETHRKLAAAYLALDQIADARKEAGLALQQAPASADVLPILSEAIGSKEDLEETEKLLRAFPNRESEPYQLALAGVLLRKGDEAESETAANRVLALNPKSSRAHLALAAVALHKNDVSKAGSEMQAAAELASPRGPARFQWAQFQLRTGAREGAKAWLDEMNREAPDYIPAWILRARIAFSEKQSDVALALLDKAIGKDRENVDARVLRSEVWSANGQSAKAVEDLDQLAKTYPNQPLVQYSLARALAQGGGDIGRAVELLEKAILERPDFSDAIFFLAQVNLQAGRPEAVVGPMIAVLQKRPGLLQAEVLLAGAYSSMGKPDAAAEIYRAHIKAAPGDAQPYFMLGMLLRQQGKTEEAQTAFEEAQKLNPGDLATAYQLVEMDLARHDPDGAQKRLAAAAKAQPNAPAIEFLEGRILAAQKDWPRAEAALLKAVEADPNLLLAYDLLITSYLAENKTDSAVGELQQVIARNPSNVSALMILGKLYERKGERDKAAAAYEKLLSINGGFAPALNNLAYLYSQEQSRLNEAAALARKARSLKPADPSIADTLGWILYEQGSYLEAMALLGESAPKLGSNPEAQYHVGMANYMMGNVPAAQSALRAALQSPSEFPGRDEIPRRLARLTDGEENGATSSLEELRTQAAHETKDPVLQIHLASACEKAGKPEEAAAAFERALQANPALLAVLTKLAELNLKPLQKPEKALDYAKKAHDLAPDDSKVAALLGRAQFENHNLALAYALLEESIRKDDSEPENLAAFAWAAYSLGKIPEARLTMQKVVGAQDVDRAMKAKSFLAMTARDEDPTAALPSEPEVEALLAREPNNVPALMVHAAALAGRNDKAGAADAYEAALHCFPDFAPAERDLAELWVESPENRAKAYDLAVKAHKALPEDLELAQALGQLSYEQKEFASAARLLESVAKRKPLDAKKLFFLGMSYWQLKETGPADDALHRALAAGLEAPFSTDAGHTLSEIEKK